MVQEFKLDLPLFTGGKTRLRVDGSKTKPTKKHWLTLNNYRNWHYQTSSQTKIDFKKDIQNQIDALPNLTELWGAISFYYVLYPPNKASRDLTNSVSIVDKYFADALVESGKLQDDNCAYVRRVSCEVGVVDKLNPRMEVFIRQYTSEI